MEIGAWSGGASPEAPASYRVRSQVGFARSEAPDDLAALRLLGIVAPEQRDGRGIAFRDALLRLVGPGFLMPLGVGFWNWSRATAERRSWVWASLGSAPLSQALEHLATIAQVTERMAWGTSISEIMHNYAEAGWVADLAVLDALASVERLDDVKAVRAAVRGQCIARGWKGSLRRFRTLWLHPSRTATKQHLRRRLRTERACYLSMAFGSIWHAALERCWNRWG